MIGVARVALAFLLALAACGPALAQGEIGPPVPSPASDPTSAFNPIALLDSAAGALPGGSDEEVRGISGAMSVLLLLTVLALAPSIMLMTTCFMRIIVVLALLRQALGTANVPPPQVITALALFMTMTVMAPTVQRVWDDAVVPYQRGEVADYEDLWGRARQPFRDFMFEQIAATGNWSSLYVVLEHRGVDISDPSKLTRADVDTASLVSGYMLSELKTAFLMGFKVYLPFLVIDMVIASLLISMSMMMLPPVLISLPFKLLLFVLVDGWTLVVGGLLASFAPVPGVEHAAAAAWPAAAEFAWQSGRALACLGCAGEVA
ncbi:MAG: flagellar type III secretion system pore protein FliP [Phycisphaerales bacterium]|nr:flagellar type III secretion system pore protein FliP [Phycisphaerales bacterium]